MRTVMAFGTFDLLHSGHSYYLEAARKLGDELVVVVARNKNVLALKGKSPVNSEKVRLEKVGQLSFVDKAVLGDSKVKNWLVVKRFNPAVIALGFDQWPSIPGLRKQLEAVGLKPEIVRIGQFKPE